MFDGMREAFLGPSEPTAQQQLDEACCGNCPKMTYQQRLIGCASCIGIGFLLEIGSFARLIQTAHGNATGFAVFYTLGNIVAVCGSFFLVGPRAQWKKMIAKTRIITVAILILAMVLTLFFALFEPHNHDAFGGHSKRFILIILCILIQFFAIVWYTLSYIPLARDCVIRSCTNMCNP